MYDNGLEVGFSWKQTTKRDVNKLFDNGLYDST